jgi:hypothetical protein
MLNFKKLESPTLRLAEFSFKHSKAESESRRLRDSASRGVVFRLRISPQIRSQKRKGWKKNPPHCHVPLKVLTNEKRGDLKAAAFDRSPFKLFTLRFSNKSVQAPFCERPRTAQRTSVVDPDGSGTFCRIRIRIRNFLQDPDPDPE